MNDATHLTPHPTGIPPGECSGLRGEDSVDEALIKDAVAHINGIHTAKGLETAKAIGQYVVATFFDRDLDAFNTRGKKHKSFKALAQHDDLSVSASTLWYSVVLLRQMNQLPHVLAGALPVSHHRLLAHVNDPEVKVRLAKEAVEHRLGKRELETRIQATRAKEPTGRRRGRPSLPGFVKGIAKVTTAVDSGCFTTVTADEIAAHGLDLAKAKLIDVDRALEALAAFKERLAVGIATAEASSREPLEEAVTEPAGPAPAARDDWIGPATEQQPGSETAIALNRSTTALSASRLAERIPVAPISGVNAAGAIASNSARKRSTVADWACGSATCARTRSPARRTDSLPRSPRSWRIVCERNRETCWAP